MPSPAPKNNRVVWIVLGTLLLLVLCCCGGGSVLSYFGLQRGTETDREAKVFATKAVKAMGKSWSAEEFELYGSPALKKTLASQKSDLYLSAFRNKLGRLKELSEFTTQSMHFGSQNGLPPATRVTLNAPATFEKGTGTIVVVAAKADEKWGIEKINVQSDALLK